MCCSGDKILNFKPLKLILYSVVGVYIGLLISGCVSVVPGTEYGGSYCVATKNTKEYRETVKKSTFSYGRYKGYPAGVNGTLCELTKFHVLEISWETSEGFFREEKIDLQPLIAKLKSKNKIPMAYGPPRLTIELNDKKIKLFYGVYELYSKKVNETKYLIYSFLN